MRYWFLKLEVRAGEYEVMTSSVQKTQGMGEFDSNAYAQDYWDGGEDTYDSRTYYFDGGCVAVSVYDCFEITLKEYNTMLKYL
jgi:hypothetical protein